ncbi:MAG: DUF4349 domain-containing protein [Clostridiales bacterium]|jgi:hypothetical protein|nr:DUF4349 domain-containing protein [Clostridiales bacterium]
MKVKFAVLLVALTVLAGCSSKNNEYTSSSNVSLSSTVAEDMDMVSSEATIGEIFNDTKLQSAPTPEYNANDNIEQKIIKTANISVNIKNYSQSNEDIRNAVEACGGYIETSSSYIYYNSHDTNLQEGYMTLRVPQESYDSIISLISGLGKVTETNESAQNATTEYYDTEARLSAKQTEEQRLLQLLDKAETIDEIISVEERLAAVRADIEMYTSHIQNIDRSASYSTINVNLREVKDEVIEPVSDDLLSRIKNAFIGSINSVGRFFEAALVFVASAFIPIIIIAVFAVVIILILRNNKKKKNKKDKVV